MLWGKQADWGIDMIISGDRIGLPQPTSTDINDTWMVNAEINHSRWIANCPFCTGAEYVFLDNPVFLCQSCFNDGSKRPLMVNLPKGIAKIEAELNKRQRLENRNWQPGETVKQLKDENLANGVN